MLSVALRLNRLLYSLLEFKPRNLKNPILNFEYISLLFLKS